MLRAFVQLLIAFLLISFVSLSYGENGKPFLYLGGCAEAGKAENEIRLEGMRILVENDTFSARNLFGGGASTDRWYTNGIKVISTQCPGAAEPRRLEGPLRTLAQAFLAGAKGVQYGYTVGQLMFTPERIDVAAPQPNDRFWGGYAFLGSIAQVARPGGIETVELDVGVLGPLSLAGPAQRLVHKAFDAPIPRGWDNQLRTEPAINVHYLNMGRALPPLALGTALALDFTPHYGFAAGTVFDYVHAGATLRLGDDLGAAPAGTIEIPSLGGIGRFQRRWNVFLRADLRATAYNAFIDGGLLRSDPHASAIERRALSAMLNWGFTLEERGWRLTLLLNRRGPEFRPGGGTQRFGTVNLELEYDLLK